MKKTIWLTLILLVLLVAFAACENNETNPTDTTAPDMQEETTPSIDIEDGETVLQETTAPDTETSAPETETIAPDTETSAPDTETTAPEPETAEPVHTHAWGDWTIVLEATCTDTGSQERTCACGEKETQPINRKSHAFEDWITITKPKCEEGGQAQRYCSICYLNQTKPVAATGHDEVIDAAVTPTCTKTGLTEGKHCSVCSAVLVAQTTIEALGHTPGQEATCTTAQFCTVCDIRLAAAKGHIDSEWILDKASTCVENGSRHKACTVCNETVKTETLSLVDHVGSDWIVERPATCTENGLRYIECTVCGTRTDQKTIVALGHSAGEWILDKASTCVENGSRHKACTVCGEETQREVLLALGHNNYVASETPPTATADGYTDYVCSKCGVSYRETITPQSLAITSSNRILIGYTGAIGEELNIPAVFQHNGDWYRVTHIGERAFNECHSLTSIAIPDSVVSIGQAAFSGCSSLESITLPFVGNSLKTAEDTYQYPLGYIFGEYRYSGGVATKQYYYGSSTSSTTSATYFIPASLKSVTITGGNILYGAFYNCDSLTTVVISDSETSIHAEAFSWCFDLTEIHYAGSMSQWKAIYSKNIPAVVYCCDGTLPASIICHVSFDECNLMGQGIYIGDCFQPGQSQKWDYVADIEDLSVEYIRLLGWIVFKPEIPGIYGYQIDDNAPVFDEAFSRKGEEPLVQLANDIGGKSVSRFNILVPVNNLLGEHTVNMLVKNEAGEIETVLTFVVRMPDSESETSEHQPQNTV